MHRIGTIYIDKSASTIRPLKGIMNTENEKNRYYR